MALLWIDGFEKYGPSGGTILPTDILDWKYLGHYDERIDIVSGRSGNAIRIDNTATNLETPSLKTPGSTDNTLIVGFAFNMSALTDNQRIVEFRDPTDHGETVGWGQLYLTVNGGGDGSEIDAYRGNTLLATSTTANLQTNTWYYLEMKVLSHDTTGTCNVALDETEVISFSGDTRHRTNNSQVTYTKVLWRVNAAENLLIDDLYIADGDGTEVTDFLGDCEVATLSPTSDVSGTDDWAPNTGSDLYAVIDEDQQDANYISDDASGNQALFETTNLTANQAAKNIKGVMISCDSQQSTQGMTQYAKAITQNGSGGTIQDTGNFMPGVTNPLTYTVMMEKDPDGNGWSAATVNSLRIGVEAS